MALDNDGAKRILEVIPRTMHTLRAELRTKARTNFSVPQFRVLNVLSRGPQNNNQLAEHIGVSVAAMSRLVDGLVRGGFVGRSAHASDRRQTQLVLTTLGARTVRTLKTSVQRRLAERISVLEPDSKQALVEGLQVLEGLFP
jgi:DNA-binding MarR family transcriptional regulator